MSFFDSTVPFDQSVYEEIVEKGVSEQRAEMRTQQLKEDDERRKFGPIYKYWYEGDEEREGRFNIFRRRKTDGSLIYEGYKNEKDAERRASSLNFKQDPSANTVYAYDVKEADEDDEEYNYYIIQDLVGGEPPSGPYEEEEDSEEEEEEEKPRGSYGDFEFEVPEGKIRRQKMQRLWKTKDWLRWPTDMNIKFNKLGRDPTPREYNELKDELDDGLRAIKKVKKDLSVGQKQDIVSTVSGIRANIVKEMGPPQANWTTSPPGGKFDLEHIKYEAGPTWSSSKKFEEGEVVIFSEGPVEVKGGDDEIKSWVVVPGKMLRLNPGTYRWFAKTKTAVHWYRNYSTRMMPHAMGLKMPVAPEKSTYSYVYSFELEPNEKTGFFGLMGDMYLATDGDTVGLSANGDMLTILSANPYNAAKGLKDLEKKEFEIENMGKKKANIRAFLPR